MKEEPVHSKLDEIAHVCTAFDLAAHTKPQEIGSAHDRGRFTQLPSVNWRVQVRRKTRYVAETFRRRKDGEECALAMSATLIVAAHRSREQPKSARTVRPKT